MKASEGWKNNICRNTSFDRSIYRIWKFPYHDRMLIWWLPSHFSPGTERHGPSAACCCPPQCWTCWRGRPAHPAGTSQSQTHPICWVCWACPQCPPARSSTAGAPAGQLQGGGGGHKQISMSINCLISISINRLFEPTYWMYEPLISIWNLLWKYYDIM